MDKQLLSQFYNNEAMREVVKLYLLDTLSTEALNKVFKKQDVSGIADAKTAIDKSFQSLKEMFEKKPTPRSRSNR